MERAKEGGWGGSETPREEENDYKNDLLLPTYLHVRP